MLNCSKTAVFLLILLAISCAPKKKEVKIEKNKSLFEKGLVVATIKGKKIEEASGLVTSAINPGMFWTHNDSGADAELFLIDQEGNIHLKVFLAGAQSIDWEDIARHGTDLYIADMGDNDAKREYITIYKIKEPQWDSLQTQLTLDSFEQMSLQYAEGARDAESLLFDHRTEELIIVTKREKNCHVYAFPFEPNIDPISITSKGTLPATLFTAGDIHPSTGEILLKNYKKIYYWGASEKPAVLRIAEGPDYTLPYKEEPQGEAIAWTDEGFVTLSERKDKKQKFYFYERK